MATHDRNGQPTNAALNKRGRTVREVDELIGLCKGIVADGVINSEEALFLQDWLEHNRESRGVWPASVLYPRIQSMLADGTLDNEEERELLGLLVQVSGGNPKFLDAHSLTSTLPLNSPIPSIVIPGNSFCFTGKLLYGSRTHCEEEISSRGGKILGGVSQDLNFLVIGLIGSRDWVHSTFGRKIEKAVAYRSKGVSLSIVAEEHFVNALK